MSSLTAFTALSLFSYILFRKHPEPIVTTITEYVSAPMDLDTLVTEPAVLAKAQRHLKALEDAQRIIQPVSPKKMSTVRYCPLCKMMRSKDHDCVARSPTDNNLEDLAWVGDAQVALDLRLIFLDHSSPAYSDWVRNSTMKIFLEKHYPERCPAVNPNGTTASEHTYGTYFEAWYWKDPKFRSKYLGCVRAAEI